ncbi:hypothetical protein GCM10011391_35820 [Pullulanibacillus camelliae]|uniref:CheW-like domain-containing protein n=1 Tax=Pullulanibacillus camelliae TaxID=1707096 RepID=A0A8J3DYN0_9BACL|nr:chemotaxis protein CheW [Pullulanibacillus camelliae]GGE53731.1 hypothetical protein GCM10011391_35820 [Pullulanibacillus camelliae]
MTSTSKDLIIFTLENYTIGIGVSDVDEVTLPTEVKPLPMGLPALIGLFRVRETICPLIDIAKLLNLKAIQATREDERRVLILKSSSQKIGIEVDRISDILALTDEQVLNADESVAESLPYTKYTIIVKEQTIHVLDVQALIDTLINEAEELFTLQN